LGCEAKPVSEMMLDACLQHSWPGNVRELENFVKGYVVLDDEEPALSQLEVENKEGFAEPNRAGRPSQGNSPDGLKSIVREVKAQTEKEAIVLALRRSAGSRKRAAHLLKISVKALHYKIHEYGIMDRIWQLLSDLPDESGNEHITVGEQRPGNSRREAATADRSAPDWQVGSADLAS